MALQGGLVICYPPERLSLSRGLLVPLPIAPLSLLGLCSHPGQVQPIRLSLALLVLRFEKPPARRRSPWSSIFSSPPLARPAPTIFTALPVVLVVVSVSPATELS